MRKTLLATFLAAGLANTAAATDLLQYYREALSNDAQFASARATFTAAQERIPQARAGLLPQISTALGLNYVHSDVENRSPVADVRRDYNSFTFNISLTQPLFRWSNLQVYEQSKLQVMAAEAQFAQARQDVILRVTQAYFDVLAAQDNLTFIGAQKEAITEQLAAARRNFEVGTATITDTNEAQARFDLVLAQEIVARNDLDTRRANLQQVIGRTPDQLAPLRSGVRLMPADPANIDAWVGNAEEQNYLILQQLAGVEIARRQVEIARSGRYPTVDFVASRNFSHAPVPATQMSSTTHAIGVQVAIPLYTGGLTSSRERESLALVEKARSDLEFSRRTAAQAARQGFFGVNNGLAQVRALEAAELSSQTALDSNRLGYEVGVRINVDVLNAQQQLFQTRRDLARARYDTLLNGLRLKAAAGTLTEADIAQVNALLATPIEAMQPGAPPPPAPALPPPPPATSFPIPPR